MRRRGIIFTAGIGASLLLSALAQEAGKPGGPSPVQDRPAAAAAVKACRDVPSGDNPFDPDKQQKAWTSFEQALMTCKLALAKAEIEELNAPDARGGGPKLEPAAPGKPVEKIKSPRDRFVDLNGGDEGFVTESPPVKPRYVPPNNYPTYDWEGSQAPVISHTPGDGWVVERDGIPIGVLRLGDPPQVKPDLKKLGDAMKSLGDQAKAAAGGSEASSGKAMSNLHLADAASSAASQLNQDYTRSLIASMQSGLAVGQTYAGVEARGSSPAGAGSIPPTCQQQMASAASRLASFRTSAEGACNNARLAVRLYTEAEQAYAGCAQYYPDDYRATVAARRQAEAAVAATCM